MGVIIINKEDMSSPLTNSVFTKILEPCFFHNTGGCYHPDGRQKSSNDCNFLHISVDYPVEKPQHLKIPCVYYHLQKNCNNDFCKYGHSELSENRWKRTFGKGYPGMYYTKKCKWSRNSRESRESTSSETFLEDTETPLTETEIETILNNSGIYDFSN